MLVLPWKNLWVAVPLHVLPKLKSIHAWLREKDLNANVRIQKRVIATGHVNLNK